MPELKGAPMITPQPRSRQSRQERPQRRLVEQGVAAGKQEAIEIRLRQAIQANLPIVDPDADGGDGALVAQPSQGAIAAVHGFGEAQFLIRLAMVVWLDVVDQGNVDPIHAEALKAVLGRAHHAVIAVLMDHFEREPAGIVFRARPSSNPGA